MSDISIMFGAATDTTSTTLEYCIYLLMKRPDIQEMVYNDLKKVAGDDESNYHVKTFVTSVLFKAFIYECLRISCVVSRGLAHTCKKDTVVTISQGNNNTNTILIIILIIKNHMLYLKIV